CADGCSAGRSSSRHIHRSRAGRQYSDGAVWPSTRPRTRVSRPRRERTPKPKSTSRSARPRCYTPRAFPPASTGFPEQVGFPHLWKGPVDTENAPVAALAREAEAVWARVLQRAKNELPDSSYSMWFADVRPTSLERGVLQVVAPSDYVREWLARHYMDLILGAAKEAAGTSVQVRVSADPAAREARADPVAATVPSVAGADQAAPARSFPDRYTFDSFVPGASNRFAHAAAMAVAEAPPSRAYN